MKRLVLILSGIALASALYAQNGLPEHRFVAGKWAIQGDRLFQNDEKAALAKVNIRSEQSGPMSWEFNTRYESGAEDGHGGFGLHIFEDRALNAQSWGAGSSWLLWLNYDEKPISKNIPAGLSAQLYRSYTDSYMALVESYDLSDYERYLTPENLAAPVPFRIEADGNTGEIHVYDPTDMGTYWVLQLDKRGLPLKGNWTTLRTNGMKLSFGNGLN